MDKVAGQDSPVSGPAVDRLVGVVQRMFGLGAPVMRDDTGFNQRHHGDPVLNRLALVPPGTPITVGDAVHAVEALRTYRYTQVQEWESLKADVAKAIQSQVQSTAPAAQPGQKKAKRLGDAGYGKVLFEIPGLNPRAPSAAVRDRMKELGDKGDRRYQPKVNDWGKDQWPVFKGFAVHKGGIDQYEVHPEFFGVVGDALRQQGYDVSDMSAAPVAPAAPAAKPAAAPAQAKGKVKKVVPEEVAYGKVAYEVPGLDRADQQAVEAAVAKKMQELLAAGDARYQGIPTFKGFAWHKKPGQYEIHPKFFETVGAELAKIGYDASELLPKAPAAAPAAPAAAPTGTQQGAQAPKPPEAAKLKDVFKFLRLDQGPFHVGIKSFDKEANAFLKEALRYTFPVYLMPDVKPEDADRTYNKGQWRWEIKGSLSQYGMLAEALENSLKRAETGFDGYSAKGLRQLASDMVAAKAIKVDKTPGELDGYQTPEGKNDPDKFDAELDASLRKKPYPKQKDGIRFLYARQSAILGDSTGAGKTLQMIAAANMRLKQSGGNALIITLPAVTLQWGREIEAVTGGEKAEFSADKGGKWTVLYYHMFSNPNKVPAVDAQGQPILEPKRERGLQVMDPQTGKPQMVPKMVAKRDSLVERLRAMKFTCLILDECHNVKNESITSENIERIAEGIPFKWGASATVIANRPIDAYRQLKILGHPLGRISEGRFKRDFGGMQVSDGVYVDGSPEDRARAAGELRKWLRLTRAYVKRTKKDINPDMPDFTTGQVPVQVDLDKFDRLVARKLKEYKDASLPVSQMIAQRDVVALLKVPSTLDLSKNILAETRPDPDDPNPELEARGRVPKKVMVFTAFRGSEDRPGAHMELVRGLEDIVAQQEKSEGKVPLPEGQRDAYVEQVVGGLSREEVSAAVQRFKQKGGRSRAMVLMVQAGGTGIDVPNVVDDVITNDFDWTPARIEQERGRAFRISSKTPVHHSYVVATNTPDSALFQYVEEKIKISEIVQNLEQKELEEVLGTGEREEIARQRAELLRRQQEIDQKMTDLASKGGRTAQWIRSTLRLSNPAKEWVRGNCKFGQ